MTNQERLIKECKREAKFRSKYHGTQHQKALHYIAQELGYKNWDELITKNQTTKK